MFRSLQTITGVSNETFIKIDFILDPEDFDNSII